MEDTWNRRDCWLKAFFSILNSLVGAISENNWLAQSPSKHILQLCCGIYTPNPRGSQLEPRGSQFSTEKTGGGTADL